MTGYSPQLSTRQDYYSFELLNSFYFNMIFKFAKKKFYYLYSFYYFFIFLLVLV